LSTVIVVCCQRSLRRIDHSSKEVLPTVARRCMWSTNLENEEAKSCYSAVKIHQWVVTPRKQTNSITLSMLNTLSSICHWYLLTLTTDYSINYRTYKTTNNATTHSVPFNISLYTTNSVCTGIYRLPVW